MSVSRPCRRIVSGEQTGSFGHKIRAGRQRRNWSVDVREWSSSPFCFKVDERHSVTQLSAELIKCETLFPYQIPFFNNKRMHSRVVCLTFDLDAHALLSDSFPSWDFDLFNNRTNHCSSSAKRIRDQ